MIATGVMLPIGKQPLRFGYVIDDARRLAIRAAAGPYTRHTLPHDERVEVAWHAIIVHLYEATDYPPPRHLGYLAQRAIQRASEEADRHWGINRRTSHQPGSRPHFARYWSTRNHDSSHADRTVERVALTQVLALLTEAQRHAVAALAFLGTRRDAAHALGLTDSGLQSHLSRGRQTFLAAWFEGETPPHRRRDRRVGSYRRATDQRHSAQPGTDAVASDHDTVST